MGLAPRRPRPRRPEEDPHPMIRTPHRAPGSALPRVLAAAVLAAAAGAVMQAPPASAAACSTRDGVSVVIDFGGSIRTGCAAGDPASAWQAVTSAGFTLEGTQRFPATFVCRVDGYPTPANEPCVQTPPATAYWALWSAPAGGSWSYSTTGAASLNPAPGTVVALAFGAGRQPAMAPPAPAPTTPAPSPSTSKGSQSPAPGTSSRPVGSTAPSSTPSTTRTGRATSSGRTPTSPDAASSGATSPGASADPSLAGSTSSATDRSTGTVAAADAGRGPTQPALVISGGAATGLLLILGALLVRRQRDRARDQ